MPEPWICVDEVSTDLGVANDSVYRWIEHKRLPVHRVGSVRNSKLAEGDERVHAGGAGDDDMKEST